MIPKYFVYSTILVITANWILCHFTDESTMAVLEMRKRRIIYHLLLINFKYASSNTSRWYIIYHTGDIVIKMVKSHSIPL